ncbi:hypothetical protein IV203_011597 [Nitzschia inconspicua]|uniref:Uncharacterized protein n=1 Tax=Nitzschia inconspicua TaxID=303405 RepID=A0A9K3PJ09_9STRA|nr:hypothetical protein IV203_011597 [Nitzschia inconspicua]
MLDGEKNVCLPCEGFTIHESIDGYVWLMESVVAMAPGRKLCDIKFIIGDGIFAAETILTKLELLHVPSEAKATLIGSDNLAEFTDGLGDPMFCVVEEPCGSVRETIKEWMQPGRNIPVEAVHVVVRKCFYSATRQDSSRNVLEVFIWGEGGKPVGEHFPSYYPVNKVAQWIVTNCTARRRKKHILSCLQKPVQGLSQHLYNYGTSP